MKTRFKAAVILLLPVIMSMKARSQGIGQWFNQNQTQDEYLLQQIAALQVYKGYLQKGYSIAKNGTGAISSIKNNDLNMHAGHFDSLKMVSSRVRNYSKVKAAIQLQQQIISGHDQTARILNTHNSLTAADLDSYNTIYRAILQRSDNELEELRLVITNGKLQMSDDERIAAIDKLYAVMQNLSGQAQKLNFQILALAAQRSRERKDRAMLKSLYGQ